ncbi:hypothetical protein [Mucilaginibacter sp. UYCu711]|uniref:hypothetical protein n=1 Tax=Mucilaginibacter sp. UYCu711 TaxID=3156339 RepID=UPI003D262A38
MKKTWSKPELYILSQDPLQAKHLNTVREGTGHYVTTTFGYKGFVNAGGTKVVEIGTPGNPLNHKSDLLS